MKPNSLQTQLLALMIVGGAVALAAKPTSVQPDNSAVNQRDDRSSLLTADSQAQSSTQDVELTRLIRRALTQDKSLSQYAQNIKIVTIDGVATLRGPVKSLGEKEKVAACAKKVVGRANVSNQIEIVK